MVELVLKHKKTVNVDADIKDCWKLLYNYEKSVGHMPDIKTFKKLKKDYYRWETKKVGYGALSFKLKYETRFETSKNKYIAWNAVPGKGNAEVSGKWTFLQQPRGTRGTKLTFSTDAMLSINIPSLARGLAQRMAQNELEKTITIYIRNIQNTLAGMAKTPAKAKPRPKAKPKAKAAAKPKVKPKAKATPKKVAASKAKPKAKPKAKATKSKKK